MNRITRWFLAVWPRPSQRRTAALGYTQIAPHTLADIGVRGRLWRTSHAPNDPYTTAFNEGRRSLALEIVELAGKDARELMRLVDPTPERKAE